MVGTTRSSTAVQLYSLVTLIINTEIYILFARTLQIEAGLLEGFPLDFLLVDYLLEKVREISVSWSRKSKTGNQFRNESESFSLPRLGLFIQNESRSFAQLRTASRASSTRQYDLRNSL